MFSTSFRYLMLWTLDMFLTLRYLINRLDLCLTMKTDIIFRYNSPVRLLALLFFNILYYFLMTMRLCFMLHFLLMMRLYCKTRHVPQWLILLCTLFMFCSMMFLLRSQFFLLRSNPSLIKK